MRRNTDRPLAKEASSEDKIHSQSHRSNDNALVPCRSEWRWPSSDFSKDVLLPTSESTAETHFGSGDSKAEHRREQLVLFRLAICGCRLLDDVGRMKASNLESVWQHIVRYVLETEPNQCGRPIRNQHQQFSHNVPVHSLPISSKARMSRCLPSNCLKVQLLRSRILIF